MPVAIVAVSFRVFLGMWKSIEGLGYSLPISGSILSFNSLVKSMTNVIDSEYTIKNVL